MIPLLWGELGGKSEAGRLDPLTGGTPALQGGRGMPHSIMIDAMDDIGFISLFRPVQHTPKDHE